MCLAERNGQEALHEQDKRRPIQRRQMAKLQLERLPSRVPGDLAANAYQAHSLQFYARAELVSPLLYVCRGAETFHVVN